MLLPSALFAGTSGKISGTAVDKEPGEPLAGVNVLIEGTSMGAAIDAEGYYAILNIPVGAYDLRAIYISYKEVVVQNQRISLDLTTEANFELEHNDSIDSAVIGFVKGN